LLDDIRQQAEEEEEAEEEEHVPAPQCEAVRVAAAVEDFLAHLEASFTEYEEEMAGRQRARLHAGSRPEHGAYAAPGRGRLETGLRGVT